MLWVLYPGYLNKSKKLNILICLNLDRSIPLRYVSSMTKAGFKIGKYDPPDARIFDFMIKVEEKPNLRSMIDQVNHYLKLIRNEKYEET